MADNVDLDFNDVSDDELDHKGEEEYLVEEIGLHFSYWPCVDSTNLKMNDPLRKVPLFVISWKNTIQNA